MGSRRWIGAFLLAGWTLGIVPVPGPAEPQKTSPSAAWDRLSGRVESADVRNRKLRIRNGDGRISQVHVGDEIEILRWWRLVSLQDLRPNDPVVIRRVHP